jgi:hypothetical protein
MHTAPKDRKVSSHSRAVPEQLRPLEVVYMHRDVKPLSARQTTQPIMSHPLTD